MCDSCIKKIDFINTLAFDFFSFIRFEPLTEIMIRITDLGSPQNLTMLCLVLALVLWIHKKTRHVVMFLLATFTGAIIVILTKLLVQLPRPFGSLISEEGYSFASGHATIAAIFFILIAYSYKSHINNSFLRMCFIVLCILCTLLVGASRVYLGVHYATDVLAGFLIGTIVSAISITMLERYDNKHPRSHGLES